MHSRAQGMFGEKADQNQRCLVTESLRSPENDPSRATGGAPMSNYRFLSVAQVFLLCVWSLAAAQAG